ncbi:adenine nucleotide alpha hydrolase family protein [Streptoalloteichus hindustanus]|uniref:hypothetical protein n=1 Tax=Streptoalloteichus hindustanus TaxID=2017 RepID=UPI000936581D|nr:hypothetical protein [Streptoalloteichus hindustanus]
MFAQFTFNVIGNNSPAPPDDPPVLEIDSLATSDTATTIAFDTTTRHTCPLHSLHTLHSPLDIDSLHHLIAPGPARDNQLAQAEQEVREQVAPAWRRFPGRRSCDSPTMSPGTTRRHHRTTPW